jgi:hypothetical protein
MLFQVEALSILFVAVLGLLVTAVPEATFPLQFSGNLEITSHLIEEASSYPPRTRRMTIYYDYINKKARAEIEAGYEAAKYYIRRYDQENEYMVRLPPIDDCKRSFLGETMPFPDLSDAVFVKEVVLDDIPCNYFLHVEYDVRVHIYMALDDGAPVKLIQENVMADGTSIPLLTYDYTDVMVGQPEEEWFELSEPYEHATCKRHIGGFPYLHIFHYFVKF